MESLLHSGEQTNEEAPFHQGTDDRHDQGAGGWTADGGTL